MTSDEQLPSEISDDNILPHAIRRGPPAQSKRTTIHLFRIRKLQSEIHWALYVPSAHRPPLEPAWFDAMEANVKEWKLTAPPGVGFCSNEWLDLCYHMTMTLLYRPSPNHPSPPRIALKKALDGSASTMRVYKDMYRMGRINFSGSTQSSSLTQ